MFAEITSYQNYVEVDCAAFVGIAKVPFKIGYIMKDQTLVVYLDENSNFVKIIMANDISFKLDMNAAHGLPAKIDGVTPTSNADLAKRVADLRTL